MTKRKIESYNNDQRENEDTVKRQKKLKEIQEIKKYVKICDEEAFIYHLNQRIIGFQNELPELLLNAIEDSEQDLQLKILPYYIAYSLINSDESQFKASIELFSEMLEFKDQEIIDKFFTDFENILPWIGSVHDTKTKDYMLKNFFTLIQNKEEGLVKSILEIWYYSYIEEARFEYSIRKSTSEEILEYSIRRSVTEQDAESSITLLRIASELAELGGDQVKLAEHAIYLTIKENQINLLEIILFDFPFVRNNTSVQKNCIQLAMEQGHEMVRYIFSIFENEGNFQPLHLELLFSLATDESIKDIITVAEEYRLQEHLGSIFKTNYINSIVNLGYLRAAKDIFDYLNQPNNEKWHALRAEKLQEIINTQSLYDKLSATESAYLIFELVIDYLSILDESSKSNIVKELTVKNLGHKSLEEEINALFNQQVEIAAGYMRLTKSGTKQLSGINTEFYALTFNKDQVNPTPISVIKIPGIKVFSPEYLNTIKGHYISDAISLIVLNSHKSFLEQLLEYKESDNKNTINEQSYLENMSKLEQFFNLYNINAITSFLEQAGLPMEISNEILKFVGPFDIGLCPLLPGAQEVMSIGDSSVIGEG